MKKIIISLLMLLPLAVYADLSDVKVPKWSDFAPSTFVDVKEPKGLMSKVNVAASYWYQRRVEFEKAIEECQTHEDIQELASCYENLKTKQYQENSDYNARIEAKLNTNNNGVQEMYNRTDTMLPISNYLMNFSKMQPNEL